MLSHQVQKSHTLRADFMGRAGGKVPQYSYHKGHTPSRVSWENLVPKIPCLFWLCAGNWCYNSLTANVQSPPHLLLWDTSFWGIIKSSWTFISRKWSYAVSCIGPLFSFTKDPSPTHPSSCLCISTRCYNSFPGCSAWWSLGVWMSVQECSCFPCITEILAGFSAVFSSSPNCQSSL